MVLVLSLFRLARRLVNTETVTNQICLRLGLGLPVVSWVLVLVWSWFGPGLVWVVGVGFVLLCGFCLGLVWALV